MNSFLPLRHRLFLAATVSSLALSACTAASDWYDSASDSRVGPPVEGPRRPPARNLSHMPQEFFNPPPAGQAAPPANMPAPAAPVAAAAPAPAPSHSGPSALEVVARGGAAPKNADMNPYDHYEAGPLEAIAPSSVGTKEAASAEEVKEAPKDDNFLSRLWNKVSPSEEQAAAPSAQAVAQAEQDGAARKSLPGNPQFSKQTEETAPLAPAPVTTQAGPETPRAPLLPLAEPRSQQEPDQPEPLQAHETVLASMSAPAPDAPFAAAAQPETPMPSQPAATPSAAPVQVADASPAAGPEPVKKSWFGRMTDSLSEPFSSDAKKPAAPAADSAMDAPSESVMEIDPNYPRLSAVPEKPSEFKRIRVGQQDKLEELQSDHMAAEMARDELQNEPTGIDANEPVELTEPKSPLLKPQGSQPPAAPKKPMPWQENSQAHDIQQLLGRAEEPVPYDHAVVFDAPDAGQVAAAEIVQQPAMEVAEKQAPKASGENNWWEGWSLFKRESSAKVENAANAAPVEPAAPPAEPVAVMAPIVDQPVAQPLVTSAPAPNASQAVTSIDATITPQGAVADMNLPPVTAPAPVAEEDATTATAAANNEEGALPSPHILQDVKMLPPSRYLPRARALQTHSGQ